MTEVEKLKREMGVLIESNRQLAREIERLKESLEYGDFLLEERDRLLEAIPECEVHGPKCVPHAVEWIERVKKLGEIIFNDKNR